MSCALRFVVGVITPWIAAACALVQPATRPDAFVIRPYLAATSQSETTLGWTTSQPHRFSVRYWAAPAGGADAPASTLVVGPREKTLDYVIRPTSQPGATTAPEPVTVRQYQYLARLEGLRPSTRYRYEVRPATPNAPASGPLVSAEFRTLAPPGEPITFVAISDTQDPAIFARLSRQIAARFQPSLIVHAGDTVDRASLVAMKTDFFDPLGELAGRVAVFPTIGNHDSSALILPLFRQGQGRAFYSFDCGDVHFVCLDSWAGRGNGPKMLDWCQRDLAESKARWKIVYSHLPSYDSGPHGNTWGRADFLPLYRKHGVDVVFNGHSHGYQRTRPMFTPGENDKHPITFMVIGGGAPSYRLALEPALAAGVAEPHFLLFAASADKLSGTCYGLEGQKLDAFEVVKDAAGNLSADWVARAIPESSYGELRKRIGPCVQNLRLSGDPRTGRPVRAKARMTAGDQAMTFTLKLEARSVEAFDMAPVRGQSPAGGETAVEMVICLRDPGAFADGQPPPVLRIECAFEVGGQKASVFSNRMLPSTRPDELDP